MDMENLLKQLRSINENECNNSSKGTYCPKHNMDECSLVSEEDENVNDTNVASDEPKIPEPDSEPINDPNISNDVDNKTNDNDEIKIDDDRGVDDDITDETSDEEIKKQDDMYYQAIKSGSKIPEEVVEPDRFIRYYEQKYGVNEEEEEVKKESNSIYNESRGGYEKNKNHWLVQSLKDGEAEDHEMFPPNQKEKAIALAKKLRAEGHKGVRVCHPSKESFNENISIQVDQDDAYELIRRMSELAGQSSVPNIQIVKSSIDTPVQDSETTMEHDYDDDSEHCPHCGMEMGHCLCSNDDERYCPSCGAEEGDCDCGVGQTGLDYMTMENIDNDFGHIDHPDAGKPVNPNTYLYRAPNGPQRVTKARGGDNALIDKEHIKEDANKLFVKLKKDYRAFIAEADLKASNAPGANSPLTATDRDKFEKDPFAGEEAVTDGSRSPLSTIKRQDVAK